MVQPHRIGAWNQQVFVWVSLPVSKTASKSVYMHTLKYLTKTVLGKQVERGKVFSIHLKDINDLREYAELCSEFQSFGSTTEHSSMNQVRTTWLSVSSSSASSGFFELFFSSRSQYRASSSGDLLDILAAFVTALWFMNFLQACRKKSTNYRQQSKQRNQKLNQTI